LRTKVVTDKHVDADAMGTLLGRFAMSAASHEPQSKYTGRHMDDEDFAWVLQLAWENWAPLLTRDGDMIEKAIQFRRELPVIGSDRCLRGVVVLPLTKAQQIAILKRFMAGDIDIIPSRSGVRVPKSIADIEEGNFGLDLRKARPKVIELCDCDCDGYPLTPRKIGGEFS
jgi:hypothetical protein